MGKKILIIDDSPISRKILKSCIPKDNGYEFFEAGDGLAGLEVFKEICLLPETDLNSAAKLAERFRIAVEGLHNVFQDASISITISLGVAEMGVEHDSAEMLLKRADEALYTAKRSGRNRVVAL